MLYDEEEVKEEEARNPRHFSYPFLHEYEVGTLIFHAKTLPLHKYIGQLIIYMSNEDSDVLVDRCDVTI